MIARNHLKEVQKDNSYLPYTSLGIGCFCLGSALGTDGKCRTSRERFLLIYLSYKSKKERKKMIK